MIERRALKRVEIARLALHCVKGLPGAHPCIVKDLHDRGAGLRAHGCPHQPATSCFRFNGFQTSIHCVTVSLADECPTSNSSLRRRGATAPAPFQPRRRSRPHAGDHEQFDPWLPARLLDRRRHRLRDLRCALQFER